MCCYDLTVMVHARSSHVLDWRRSERPCFSIPCLYMCAAEMMIVLPRHQCLIGAGRNGNVFRCLVYTCALFDFHLEFAPNVQFVWPGYHVTAVALRRGGMVLATSVSLTPSTNVTEWVVSRVQWIDLPHCSALLCA